MSRAERLELDQLRKLPQATTTSTTTNHASSTVVSTAKPATNPTGYILSSKGSPYRWEDGNFRKTSRSAIDASAKDRKFEIIKHEATPTVATPSSAADESPDDAELTSDHESEY